MILKFLSVFLRNLFVVGITFLLVSSLLFLTGHQGVGENAAKCSFIFFLLGLLTYLREMNMDVK